MWRPANPNPSFMRADKQRVRRGIRRDSRGTTRMCAMCVVVVFTDGIDGCYSYLLVVLVVLVF
jgi:hypothetical protein